jgi:hypothetical protein
VAKTFTAKYENPHPCPICQGEQKKGERLTYITAHADCIYPDKKRATEDKDDG